jgi:hypothetical protein
VAINYNILACILHASTSPQRWVSDRLGLAMLLGFVFRSPGLTLWAIQSPCLPIQSPYAEYLLHEPSPTVVPECVRDSTGSSGVTVGVGECYLAAPVESVANSKT